MKSSLTLVIGFIFQFAISQNLVHNPSFEDYKRCPSLLGNFNHLVTHWSTPNWGSTDYFHACSKTVGFINFFGSQKARTGKAYSGVYVLAPENYREYIQGELLETLTAQEKYTMTFYVSLAENSSHAIKDLGILFLDKPFKMQSEAVININKVLSTEKNSHFISISSQQFYTEKDAWEKVTFEYTAKGFERFFIIGNFDKNAKITKHEVQKSKNPDAAYYYLDDIRLEAFKPADPVDIKVKTIEADQTLETDKVYALRKVFFNFNQHKLLGSSVQELDQLYNYLDNHKRLQIEIYGHTDNVGTQERNDELSLLRAKEVALYLISKGLRPERIKARGFGNRFPQTTNATQAGRALNRRVEFKLIKL